MPLLEAAWQREHSKHPKSNKNLVWALLHVFKWRMLSRFLLRLVFKVLSMISPLLIFSFTEFVEKKSDELRPEDY